MATLMQGLIIGTDGEGKLKQFRMLVFTHQGNEWKFTKQVANEKQLTEAISTNRVQVLNAKVEKGAIKGKTGDLSRFEGKVNKPLVIISELVAEGQDVIGYKISNHEGNVKNITTKELIGYCNRMTKNGGIPIQNGMYVPDKDGQKAHIRCYPNGDYIKETIERNKSKNAQPATVNSTENAKSISKLEELFNKEQINELKVGKQAGVDIKIYGNNKLSAEQMKVIREGLQEGLNTKLFADPAYPVASMRMLRADLKYGVDVSYYLNPKYTPEQLSELSLGFISGVDVSKYADPKISAEEMTEIRMRLENNIWKEHSVAKDESWK